MRTTLFTWCSELKCRLHCRERKIPAVIPSTYSSPGNMRALWTPAVSTCISLHAVQYAFNNQTSLNPNQNIMLIYLSICVCVLCVELRCRSCTKNRHEGKVLTKNLYSYSCHFQTVASSINGI